MVQGYVLARKSRSQGRVVLMEDLVHAREVSTRYMGVQVLAVGANKQKLTSESHKSTTSVN